MDGVTRKPEDWARSVIERLRDGNAAVRERAFALEVRDRTHAEVRAFADAARGEGPIVRIFLARLAVAARTARYKDELVALAEDPDGRVVSEAWSAIDRIVPEERASVVVGLLASVRPALRREAVVRLGQYKRSEAVLPLLERLEDEVAEIRREALESLRLIRDLRAIPFLARRLSDPVPEVRRQALLAVGDSADPASFPGHTLTPHLDDPDPGIRKTAAWALARLSGRSAAPALLRRLLVETDGAVACELVRRLAPVGGDRAVEAFIRFAVHSPQFALRSVSIWNLNRVTPAARRRRSTRLLRDPDERIRAQAALQLGMVRNPRDLTRLVALMRDDPSQHVRAYAAEGLGLMRQRSAIPPLLAALRGDDLVAHAVIASLARIVDSADLPLLARSVAPAAGLPTTMRAGLLRILGDVGAASPIRHDIARAIAGFLEDPDLDVRYAVYEAIGKTGDVDAVELLLSACGRESVAALTSVAISALQALFQRDPQIAPEFLRRHRTDPGKTATLCEALARVPWSPAPRFELACHAAAMIERAGDATVLDNYLHLFRVLVQSEGETALAVLEHQPWTPTIVLQLLEVLRECSFDPMRLPPATRLESCLFHRNDVIRECAAAAIGHLGLRRVLPSLVLTAERDPAENARLAARAAVAVLLRQMVSCSTSV